MKGHYTHGGCHTKLYQRWTAMRRRCYLETCKDYKNYGGRGITVCEEWRNNFEPFRDWSIANGYRSKLQIDRRNNNGNYGPDNCRWVTKSENDNNKRSTIHFTINGVTHTIPEWCEMYGIKYKTFKTRLKLGWEGSQLLIKAEKGRNQTFKKECING